MTNASAWDLGVDVSGAGQAQSFLARRRSAGPTAITSCRRCSASLIGATRCVLRRPTRRRSRGSTRCLACRRSAISRFARRVCCKARPAAARACSFISTSSCRWVAAWAAAVPTRPPCCLRSITCGSFICRASDCRLWVSRSAPTCRSSFLDRTPSPKASAKRCGRSICRRPGMSCSSRRSKCRRR